MTDDLVRSIAKETARKYYADKHPGDAGVKRVDFLAENNWDFWKEGAVRALQAIEAAGYRVVPVEATRKMRLAGEKEMMARHTNLDCFRDPYVDSTYAAMLSAAPRVGEGV